MRYLSSVGMLEERSVDMFAATNVTQALANPGQQAGVKFWLVFLHPSSYHPPEMLLQNYSGLIGAQA